LAVSSALLAAELIVVTVRTRAFEQPRGVALGAAVVAALSIVATAHAGMTGDLRRGWYLTLLSVATLVAVLLLGLDRAAL
jgi:hypothetical protein